ncbi:MAG: sigma-70 family RNA polymerase sigma factor [Bryobacteraceae bacterium]|nr:sigma-70 family RNA polymerase sigma factor [Bryobacteraceae bacterium]HEU0142937.1 sigma-70 family RNA polymerase sigma factor [Bryobacteraceae bacterium]
MAPIACQPDLLVDPKESDVQENDLPPSPAGPTPEAAQDWTCLVERIQAGEEDAMEELYQLFSKGIRFFLCRSLGSQELDDKVHDAFLIVVKAIRRGELRDPQRLMGFVRTIVRRQVAGHIDRAVHARREQVDIESGVRLVDPSLNPEQRIVAKEKADLMKTVLSELATRDREILTRFYLLEQSQEQICADMELTETQFRLLKSRAKGRFGDLGKKKQVRRQLSVFLRASSR